MIRIFKNITEEGPGLIEGLRKFPRYFGLNAISYGFVAWLFSASGPFLIILSAAQQGRLPFETVASWVFAVFFFGGILTIIMALYYQRPIVVAYSIAGVVLVGTSLTHLSFAEVVGAYLLTGLLISLLGITGLVKKAMSWIPIPIMMGMVVGVLMPFGLNIIYSLIESPLLAGLTLFAFLAFSFYGVVAKRFPPVMAAIIVGVAIASLTGQANWHALNIQLARPQVFVPIFTAAAAIELVLPLTVTVLAVHNIQTIGVLLSHKYDPPINSLSLVSGIGTIINGLFGGSPTCTAGPSTAICANPSTGPYEGRYVVAVTNGIFWIIFGLLAPVAAAITAIFPVTLINILGGLALLIPFSRFVTEAFGRGFPLGALTAFLITTSKITFMNIGAPFWGLLTGVIISFIFERGHYRELAERARHSSDPN